MIDVAACFQGLSKARSIARALRHAAGRDLTQADLSRLAALAFLHDFGKANAGFQAKYWLTAKELPRGWPLPCGHGSDAWALFGAGGMPNADRVLSGLPIEQMDAWGSATADLLRASISHHGRPVADRLTGGQQIWQPVRQGGHVIYDPAATVAAIGRAMQQHFQAAFEPGHSPLPDSPAFVHLFGGLVQMADWLGSDTREDFFPYSRPGEDRARTATARARHAVRAICLDLQPWIEALAKQRLSFEQVFAVPEPRPMQEAMADLSLGPVVILEAETGSGKTEAALWRFAALFQAGLVDSLYFALPTRVAASQLYQRVRDFACRVWPANAPPVVRALPGYVAADGETPVRLPGTFEVLWPDQPNDERAERRWAAESPKRFLAAPLAVGTVDQALLGALRVKHAHLRQAMLARSLLVVDEVHASDAYMTSLLEQLLRAHVACGGHALLLSATLGAGARVRYLNVGHQQSAEKVPGLDVAAQTAYPAISSHRAAGAHLDAVAGNPRHKTVHWKTLDSIDEPTCIAALAVEAAQRGARVLVVRNTVPAAAATLQAVECLLSGQIEGQDLLFRVAGVSTLHHSRYSRQDRPLLDQEVERQLGKHRHGMDGRIVIGTQTLEQSLDIDADLLITDLCPMDVLLQRLGRLHRHPRPSAERPDDRRPSGFEEPHAVILTPTGHDLTPLLKRQRHGLGPIRSKENGLDGVYIDLRIVEATRRLIEDRPQRVIPAENRMLVEHATHPEALATLCAELGSDWQRFGQEVDGLRMARGSIGRLQALPYDLPYGELTFPEDEQQMATRLGAADRLVEFDPPIPGPFGQTVRQLALRHHQVQGVPPDTLPADVAPLPSEPGFVFTLGPANYRYSRFGLERIKPADSA